MMIIYFFMTVILMINVLIGMLDEHGLAGKCLRSAIVIANIHVTLL